MIVFRTRHKPLAKRFGIQANRGPSGSYHALTRSAWFPPTTMSLEDLIHHADDQTARINELIHNGYSLSLFLLSGLNSRNPSGGQL